MKFKVGDRVRYIGWDTRDKGKESVVTKVLEKNRWIYLDTAPHPNYSYGEDQFVLVYSPTTDSGFKIGDYVLVDGGAESCFSADGHKGTILEVKSDGVVIDWRGSDWKPSRPTFIYPFKYVKQVEREITTGRLVRIVGEHCKNKGRIGRVVETNERGEVLCEGTTPDWYKCPHFYEAGEQFEYISPGEQDSDGTTSKQSEVPDLKESESPMPIYTVRVVKTPSQLAQQGGENEKIIVPATEVIAVDSGSAIAQVAAANAKSITDLGEDRSRIRVIVKSVE